jgi:30S ribosomal protein S31
LLLKFFKLSAQRRALFFTTFAQQKNFSMGRGDKKTKKGKTFKGSFGKSRPASKKKITGNVPAKKES